MLQFIETYVPWVNIDQLNILGVRTDHLYFMIIFMTIFVLNIVVKPILIWFTKKNYMTMLSYITSSLIVLIASYTFLFVTDYFDNNLIKFVMNAIALFGICLTILLTYNMFKKET